MTSTNDGKDVKSTITSGQKGKSHYIELYKSLDSNLNTNCELGTLTGHLCDAWRRVHSLCAHSAPSTHPHLLAWIQRHTARTVLQTQWQSPTSSDYHTTLDQTLQDFIQEAGDAIVARNGQCLQWESQLLERAVWFRSVLSNPWEHRVLKALLDANNEQPTDVEVLEWLKEERGITFVTRLRQLALSKGCDDLALTLASAVMDRMRASVLVVPDVEQLDDMREKPPSPESGPTFARTLRSDAGFSQDVLDLLADIELVLLHKRDRDPQCINLAKATPLRMGHALVERLAGRLDQAPREKKLWKNARHVASIVARVIVARCMVVPCCVGVARTALYWCARSIARLVGGDRLPTVASALAAPAATARHLHTLATANHAQLAELEDRRGFVCELYIRAITSGMNELEKLKLETTLEKEKEARQTEQTLASWFIQLGTLLSGSARVKCECMLTAFSVHPSPAMYERIKQAPVLPPLTLELSEMKQEDQPNDLKSDFGSWANDSQQQSNLVKTSQIVNIKSTQNLANVLSTALFTEGEKLGLSAELCQDLAVLLSRPRVKTFSWDMEREILLEYCRSYMERTSGGTKCLTTELRYLNLDPKTYQHLPEEQDDEDDIYYGIQKGYEHLVEFEPQPEEIWQDAHLTQEEESAESDADDETYTTHTRRKKKPRHSSESETDPLSEVAKAKHDKKKERPHSKERSKEPKKRGKKDPNKQKDKKEPKEKKQPKKEKQQKQPNNYLSDLSKPVKSELSKFLGFKVVNMSFEDEFRNSLQSRTQMDPLGTLPDPLGFNTSQPNKKAQAKSTRLGTPVTDSDYDSQGKSSRKSETPEPEASNKNFPVDDFIKSLQKIHNTPNPAVKVSLSKLLQVRKQKAEDQKNSASKDNSLAALVGSKIYNKQPIMIPDLPDTPKIVLGNKSDASSKSVSTNTSTNTKHLPNKPVHSKDSSSAPEKKMRKPRKPSTKKIIKEPSLNTNSQTSSPLQLPTKTPAQKPTSSISGPFAKASFDPNQNSYHRFLMELQETKRLALQGTQDPKPAPKSMKKSTPKIIGTGETTESAKPTQQKMETPNTFARRNHMHKTNKKIIQHHESLQFSVSREIDQRIASLTQKKMKDLQNANDFTISPFIPNDVLNVQFNVANSSRVEPRVEIQKVEEPTPASCLIAANHPVISNVLEGSVVTVARNPAYISPIPDQSKLTPGHSALSEQDQKDVLRLLMQKNKLNAKVESLAVRNPSILNIPKVYPSKNDSMNNQNQIQKPNLIYGSSIRQETMESPVIPHNTVMQTANMVQSPKPKRKPKVKNCPKKDVESPRSLSANTSPVISKAPANTSPMVLKTYSNTNQNATSAGYKSQITAPLSANTNQTLMRQVLLASTQAAQTSPTISTSGSHISIEPKKTGDMTSTSSGVTSNLKANKVQTPYPSQSQRKEDWTNVLDGLLKLKTPCRGPTALDMALKNNKDATTESLRKLRIVKSNSRPVSLERPLDTKPEIMPGQSSQDLRIPTANMEKPGIKNSPEPFTKDTFLEASKTVGDMIKKLDRKAKRRSRAKVKVPDQPLMEELVVQKPTVQYPKKDPIPSGFTRSDYDIMLGELLDDDLLQEIDESPVQCSRQNDPKNMNFNSDLVFSKPEERNMTIPGYGTTNQETQIPVTQNLQSVPNTMNDKGPVQNSKHIKMVFDLPPNPEIVKVSPKEKPRILSNVPISLGSPGIKNVLDKNAPLIIKPADKTSPKIQHPNEIVLKMPNANTNLPVQNQAQPKIVNGVPQSVFLVGFKNNYETLTIYGQSENKTVPPLISSNPTAKMNAQTKPETVNTAPINKQPINNQVVIKSPYPTVSQTVKTTPETVNTASINKQAVNTSVVFNAPYPTVGQTVKTRPETVKTTTETVNSASTSVNKHAVNTSVVFNAPYPTVGQTINIPTAPNVKEPSSNQSVHRSAYPVVGQTIKMATSNKSGSTVYVTPTPEDKAQVTTKPKTVMEATPKLQPAVIEITPKLQQNVANTTNPVIEDTTKVQQNITNSAKLALAVEATQKLQQNITTNTTKPASVVEATPKLLQNLTNTTKAASVIEATPKLQQNLTNTTKAASVIEATPKLQQNITNTTKLASFVEVTPKLQQNIANITKPVTVIEDKPKYQNIQETIPKQNIANQNEDNAKINSDRKVLSEVPEKPNIPSKIDVKKNTLLDGEMKKEHQERLIKKRLSIMNRQVDHRCFYPPIPLTYAPIIIKTNDRKNDSVTERGVKKSKSVTKLSKDKKATKASIIKGTSEDLAPTRVSKRIEMRKAKRMLAKKRIEEEQLLINQFIDESLGSAAIDETASEIKNTMSSDIPEHSKPASNAQLNDIPKHSVLSDKNITVHPRNELGKSEPEINKSTDEKLNKLVNEMATTIDIITKSTVEPVVSEEEEPFVIQTARETLLKDPLEIEPPVVLHEQMTSTTNQKDQVYKTKVIATKPLEVTYADALPKVTDKSQTDLKETNLLNNVTRKDPSIENEKIFENNVIDAQKFESKGAIVEEKDTKVEKQSKKDSTEVIDLDSGSDTEKEKLKPKKTDDVLAYHQIPKESSNVSKDQINESEISQSFKDSIEITELPSVCLNPFQRKVRIKMPNNKAFIATITGKHLLSFDDLFAMPQLRSILLNANAPTNRRIVKIKTLNQMVPDVETNDCEPGTLETIDLLSDDEDTKKQQSTKEKQCPQYFVTEFGKFRASDNLDKQMLSQHQQKFSKKCVLKLQRCKEPDIQDDSELMEEAVDLLTPPPTANREKSEQETEDSEPYVLPEVIDLDDSSNDSVVAVEGIQVPNVAPVKKINKFKNLLLKDLFSDDMLNLNPDDLLNPKNEPKYEDSSSVVTILSSDLSTIDAPIQKQDYTKIIDKECVIELTRCDDMVNYYKQKATESTSNDVLQDIATVTNDLDLTAPPSSPVITRSGSFSILNESDLDTVVHSPVIDVFQAISELNDIDKERREEVTSPVMQAYDIIASFVKKPERNEQMMQTVCEIDWFFTKPKLRQLAVRHNLEKITEDLTVINDILDESTDYEDNFNSTETGQAQNIQIICENDWFMTKSHLHFQSNNLDSCEITTTVNNLLEYSTDCEDITDFSEPESGTETAVKNSPSLKTIMANYFANNPIVNYLQHIAQLDRNLSATMSPLKRKSTLAVTNKSNKMPRRFALILRSQSDSKIVDFTKIPALFEKPNHTLVPECKEFAIAEEAKLTITQTLNVDQNDNDYLLGQKYSAGHDFYDVSKQCIDKAEETDKTISEHEDTSTRRQKDPDPRVELCATEPIMEISDSVVKQDNADSSAKIPGPCSELLVPETTIEMYDSPSVDTRISEPIMEISASLVEQDKPSLSELILEIPDPRGEPCVPGTTMEISDPPSGEHSVEVSVSEQILEHTKPLDELQEKPSSSDLKNEPCAPETTMEITDVPYGSESIVKISDSVVEQDQPSESISNTPGQKDKPCVSETTMDISDPPNVNACASEPIIENSDTLKQNQPSEPVVEILDQNDERSILETTMEIAYPSSGKCCASEPTMETSDSLVEQDKSSSTEPVPETPDQKDESCAPKTTMEISDTPSVEPVKECVSESILEDTKSLDELQENPSSSEPIVQIPDQKDEPCVPETTVEITDIPCGSESIVIISDSVVEQDQLSGQKDKLCVSETTIEITNTPSVEPCASEPIMEISDSVIKQDQTSEPISETPDQRGEPCVPVRTMDNLDLLAKVCIFQLMSKDAKSLYDSSVSNLEEGTKLQDEEEEQSAPEPIIKDTELRHEVSVPKPVMEDSEPLKEVSVSENVLKNTKLQDSLAEFEINPKGPISELRNVPSVNLPYLRDGETTNDTMSEMSIENIDWISHECVIKSDSNSANSSFESIPTNNVPFDDGKNYLSETKTDENIDEKELVLITKGDLNPTLLEHAYEKVPCSYSTFEISESTNKIKTKSERELISADIDKNEKDIHEPVVDKLIQEVSVCEYISENTIFYGDDTGVVLKKVDSEQEDPFLGFEFNTKSECSELLERSLIDMITDTEIVEEKPLEREKLYEDDKKLTLVTPKVTYSMKCRKRKSNSVTMLGNTKRARRPKSTDSNVSLGRKRKSIDARKLSVSAVNEQSYSTEFERLIDYYDTIDLSYSLSYGVEQIDATELLQNWPIKDEYKIYDGEIEVVELFADDSEMKPREFEIDKLTFAEEINAAIEQKIEAFDEADDTNFNKGFGERSGRVIQHLEQFGATSKLSAATLSDVKQYQPFLLSENINSNELILLRATEDYEIVHRFMRSVNIHRKIKQFFKNSASELNEAYENLKSKDDTMSKARFPFEKYISGDFKQSPMEITVGVVQVGQLPVSAAAQNPVTCDPRVTHVSDASPSQCSENSPSDDPEQSNKTEYTELTTADLSMPIIGQEYTHSDVPMESQDSFTPCENITIESSLVQSDIRIELEEESPEEGDIKIKTEPGVNSKNEEFSSEDPDSNSPTQSDSNAQFVTSQEECQESVVLQQATLNGSTDKNDQIAQAMNVAGITNEDEATATANRTRALVDLLTQISQGQTATSQNTTMTYPKTTTINAMSLQQALAQILPPPLNQTGENQQVPTSVSQVLHIVHNNAGGNLTLVDGNQQSVINTGNSTPMIHIVQNKVSNGCPSNGVPAQQQNSFSGISLVDAGLQQGGGQLLHIVNTGNQKNPNTGQLLKRVNLLTNLTNVQGSNEQKMLQFVCKSADGKSIQLSSPHQRSMVLRLQPIETLDVQNAQKQTESQDPNSIPTNNTSGKESASQQEIKSRSVYEENYAKFIQNSSVKPGSEKSTSLPKFNQAFGKPVFQDGSEKSSDSTTDVHLSSGNSNENTDVQTSENTINLDHITGINNPPLLLRKTTAPVSQAQPNLVQQIKQTIAPMNIQTMHGGVIYTRQIPVNIGGGQTINLISVPTTELADESGQKQSEVQFVKQGDIDGSPSIIKIVPQIPAPNAEVSEDGSVNLQNDGQNPQPQPVLTQMRIKLPMLSKNPQMIAGARVVRPSFFQIQRNVIGGANQPVYQQLVLTTAPQLGQQTIRLPQAQQVRHVKVPDNQSPPESQMSSSTLEQLREFDMVLEQVKERSTVQPNSSSSSTFQGNKTSTDTTDSPVSTSSKPTETKQVLYTIGGNHSVAYVNRKATVTTSNTPSFSRSPDSSGIVDSPSSSSQNRHSGTSETPQTTPNDGNPTSKSKSHKSKSKSKSSSHSSHSSSKVSTAVAHKPSTQKPLEDEQTTQRILYILAEYKEQVENSPDKDKPAPRRRTNPPSNSGSRRKKRRSGARDVSPIGDDSRTIGSEDSSCGTSQGDCAESCVDSVSPQSSPRKVVRKLTFDPDATPNATSTTPIRPQPPRNVIVADGQTLAVTRGASGKPATAVIMPANYLLPVSMVKGGQQIAIVTNQGPKLLTVTGGESPAANALLLQRLIGPAVKPVLARPGIRHVRLPTAALQRIQTFNLATTATAAANNSTAADSTASPAPETTNTPDEPQTSSPPWADKESESKPDRASSPEGSEPWNLPSSADPNDYSYEQTVRTDNLDRTVLEAIPDRYSPDMEAHRIFDKMFDVESKKSYVDSHHRYDIDAVDEDKTYQVVNKKDLSAARQHRLAYISAAALRHKHAILEHELRLQKSLSEECEDLGVDSPSASDLFPEAELLFSGSPAADHGHERDHDQPAPAHQPPQPTILNETLHANIEEQIATDQLLPRQDRDINLGLEDVGIVTVSEDGMQASITLDQEEFARSHPNTTFHSEPTDDGEVQQFTLPSLKGRHITSAMFNPNRTATTVLMTAPQTTVISHAETGDPVKYSHIDNIIQTPRYTSIPPNVNLNSVLVKDDGLTRFDGILTDTRELHLSNTASAIVHANTTQVIRRVCYEDDKRDRFMIDEPESVIAGKDAKMVAEDSRDATLDSMADESSPERNTELFWESNSASERSESRRPLDFSSDSDKCCKSPLYDETNSTDSSGVGTHLRLDSVIKEARGVERSRSADGSSADDTHPPLRTYPPKRSYHNDAMDRNRYNDVDRSLSGKTRAGFQTEPRHHSPDISEVRRRASNRGVVKRGCHCCNGSPAPSRPKKTRQKKSHTDFSNTH